ncbi:NERD domain-containing protein [Halobacillus fulvus]|nr:NERD domain-containing protein [Halobacillus fulvus]
METRTKSEEHTQLGFLTKRLTLEHPLFHHLHEELLKKNAGLSGEMTTDYFLQYLPTKNFHFLPNLSLHDSIQHFQLDGLVLTPTCLILLEVKNYKGELLFDFDHNQLFRTYEGRKDVFPDPFLQVEHQKLQLNRWIQQEKLPTIPIEPLIIIANPMTSIDIKNQGNSAQPKRIVRAKALPQIIPSVQTKHSKKVWREVEIESFIQITKEKSRPFKVSLMKKHSLQVEDLRPGIRCTTCRDFTMYRRRDHWRCNVCGYTSKDAHLMLLKEWRILIGDKISVRQFMTLSGLQSRKVAWKLLQEACPRFQGENRHRRYVIPDR